MARLLEIMSLREMALSLMDPGMLAQHLPRGGDDNPLWVDLRPAGLHAGRCFWGRRGDRPAVLRRTHGQGTIPEVSLRTAEISDFPFDRVRVTGGYGVAAVGLALRLEEDVAGGGVSVASGGEAGAGG